MTTTVIYHANCWDGFCAAWLFHQRFSDAEYVAAHYGQGPPDVAGRRVFILDFIYKRQVMREILSRAMAVVVLDHHKTAQLELCGLEDEFCQRPDLIRNPLGSHLPDIRFDLTKSGARLAWEYLHGQSLPPWLVRYTEDRDLWRWRLPHSREVNAWLRSHPLDFALWDNLSGIREEYDDGPIGVWGQVIAQGEAILRRERQIVADHVRHAREIDLGGHRIPAVNATVLFSEVAGELAKGRPFGACYFDRADGLRQWSLRSDDSGADVSLVAQMFGGGGHPRAAGFEEPIP